MPKFRVLLALALVGGCGVGPSAIMGAGLVLSSPIAVAAAGPTEDADDVYFKMIFSKKKVKDVPAVWHLRLPKSLIWLEIGGDDAVTGGPDSDFHSALLYASIDRDSTERSITLQSNRSRPESDGMYFSLSNGFSGKIIANSGKCVRDDDLDALLADGSNRHKCGTEPWVLRCQVRMDYMGWRVRIMMPKKDYLAGHDKICMGVREQIDKYTISVDTVTGADF
jgi:hypothetical protein